MSDSSRKTPCTRGCSSTRNASCNEVYDASTCAFGFGGGGGTESVGSLLRKDAANEECSIIQWNSAEMSVLLKCEVYHQTLYASRRRFVIERVTGRDVVDSSSNETRFFALEPLFGLDEHGVDCITCLSSHKT